MRDGSLREPKSWRLLFLSTGEMPTETKLSEDKRKPRAGQLVRLLDIPADRGAGFGAFDNGGPEGDAGNLAKGFKHAAISAYGMAGPEFVRRIIDEGAGEIGAGRDWLTRANPKEPLDSSLNPNSSKPRLSLNLSAARKAAPIAKCARTTSRRREVLIHAASRFASALKQRAGGRFSAIPLADPSDPIVNRA